MNVAIIGSGGREHALAHRCAQDSSISNLYVIPGNPGTSQIASNVELDYNDHQALLKFCMEHNVELVIIGPEKPLAEGMTDYLIKGGINVFGPTSGAAKIEVEKSFAKKLMYEFNVPTASFKIFNKKDYQDALRFISTVSYPIVIKANGIAAGKGVVIAMNPEEAKGAVDDCFLKDLFGDAGDSIVIEEFMEGREVSIFAITDGTDYLLLPAAQDHKRIYDGDKGKNTGGMGAYAPVPFLSGELLSVITDSIIEPVLSALRQKETPFIGCLYAGLMITKEGPKVVEFNCRFGDPETQALLPLMKGDFSKLLLSAAKGRIDKDLLTYGGGASVSVVAASGGYPGNYDKGLIITGWDTFTENVIVFHAGTKIDNGSLVTNGGRVLNVTGISTNNDLKEAKQKAYEALSKIFFANIYYRKDISDKARN
jgi:phosphoribosylamine---glycine ligase